MLTNPYTITSADNTTSSYATWVYYTDAHDNLLHFDVSTQTFYDSTSPVYTTYPAYILNFQTSSPSITAQNTPATPTSYPRSITTSTTTTGTTTTIFSGKSVDISKTVFYTSSQTLTKSYPPQPVGFNVSSSAFYTLLNQLHITDSTKRYYTNQNSSFNLSYPPTLYVTQLTFNSAVTTTNQLPLYTLTVSTSSLPQKSTQITTSTTNIVFYILESPSTLTIIGTS